MKTDGCREWRESLGAYALGHLSEEERAGLEAHLEGCPSCRAELEQLTGVVHPLSLALSGRASTGQNYLAWQLFRRSNRIIYRYEIQEGPKVYEGSLRGRVIGVDGMARVEVQAQETRVRAGVEAVGQRLRADAEVRCDHRQQAQGQCGAALVARQHRRLEALAQRPVRPTRDAAVADVGAVVVDLFPVLAVLRELLVEEAPRVVGVAQQAALVGRRL